MRVLLCPVWDWARLGCSTEGTDRRNPYEGSGGRKGDEVVAGVDAEVVGADDADASFAERDGVDGDERDGVAFVEATAAVVDGLGRGRVGHGVHGAVYPAVCCPLAGCVGSGAGCFPLSARQAPRRWVA